MIYVVPQGDSNSLRANPHPCCLLKRGKTATSVNRYISNANNKYQDGDVMPHTLFTVVDGEGYVLFHDPLLRDDK